MTLRLHRMLNGEEYEAENPQVDAFLAEYVSLCKRYGMGLRMTDYNLVVAVVPYDPEALMAPDVTETSLPDVIVFDCEEAPADGAAKSRADA